VIRHIVVSETSWPIDWSDESEDTAQWALRYGSTERREAQRMSVASILNSYACLIDPKRPMEDATAALRRARRAATIAYYGTNASMNPESPC
jgi:hypothetical protein